VINVIKLERTNFPIVGTKFRGEPAISLIKTLAHDTPLVLKREPENQYDNNAVAVYHVTHIHPGENLDGAIVDGAGATHLGYIPARLNTELSIILDTGNDEYQINATFDASEPGKPRVNVKLEQVHD
jgi:hypothetical protein